MNYNDQIKASLLFLVRLGVGKANVNDLNDFCIDDVNSWKLIKFQAEKQGVNAVVLDGIELLPALKRPPQVVLLEWIGEVMHGYEYRYNQYRKSISELADFYNSHGFKMMVLKGYACSLDWPKPSHRPCGDIDIWLCGKWKDADAVLVREKGLRIDNSHHHHTVFDWNEFMVENHYDFINTSRHKSHNGLESIFKKMGEDDTHFVEIEIASASSATKVYLPSPNLHALFLLRHALNHFASMGITIRQVLDWAFFVEKHTKEINWGWLNGVLEVYHMKDFANCMNAICVEDLGFSATAFNGAQFDPVLKDKVLEEIMRTNENELPQGLFHRMVFRYRRWKESAWKYQLCFKESRKSIIWNSLKSAIVKPSTI